MFTLFSALIICPVKCSTLWKYASDSICCLTTLSTYLFKSLLASFKENVSNLILSSRSLSSKSIASIKSFYTRSEVGVFYSYKPSYCSTEP